MAHPSNHRTAAARTLLACLSVLLLFVVGPAPATADPQNEPQVTVPEPEPGSFFTVFEYTHDGRVIAFDGFTVYVQESRKSATLTPIGTLPEEFRGGTDPTFVSISPNGQTIPSALAPGAPSSPTRTSTGISSRCRSGAERPSSLDATCGQF